MTQTITRAVLNALIEAAHDDVEAAHEAAVVLNADYWDCSDPEALSHTDIDDAVADYLDGCDGLPDSLAVTGYRRLRLSADEPDPDRILEDIYEGLDEEYNGGDDPSEPTKAVQAAAEAFAAIVRREYVPWNCEQFCVVTLNADEIKAIAREQWGDAAEGEGGKPNVE
jgi:hypothetical protein